MAEAKSSTPSACNSGAMSLADGIWARRTSRGCIPTRTTPAHLQPSRETLSRVDQREAHRFQPLPQDRRAALIGWRDLGQALAEGLAWTGGIGTAIASRIKAETDGKGAQGQIRDGAREPAVGVTRARLTVGTPRQAAVEVTSKTRCCPVRQTASRCRPVG